MPTILVGTDLTDQSLPAVVRGADLVRAAGGKLIVCHAAERAMPVNPLFPHEAGESIAAAVSAEQGVADAISQQVSEATGLEDFDVVVDIGDPSTVICAQAKRHRADLVIVNADRPGAGAVARELSMSPCSVLVVGPSAGDAVAIVALESEVDLVPKLAAAARAASARPVSKFVVILWADSEARKTPLLAALARTSEASGVPFEPWFAHLDDPSALARAASDPAIGLVAMAAPKPDKIVDRRASPLDDAFDGALASLLLLRG
ncbi:MAG: universal stress protein [Polyangiaceae bacterium]